MHSEEKQERISGERHAELARESANVSDSTQAGYPALSDQREEARQVTTTAEAGMSSSQK